MEMVLCVADAARDSEEGVFTLERLHWATYGC